MKLNVCSNQRTKNNNGNNNNGIQIQIFSIIFFRFSQNYKTRCTFWRWDATHFNASCSRHFCSRSTSVSSALEVFYDDALYKFTIDVDIDIYLAFNRRYVTDVTDVRPLFLSSTRWAGQSRREAARRRNSECKIVEIPLAAMAVGLQRSGD